MFVSQFLMFNVTFTLIHKPMIPSSHYSHYTLLLLNLLKVIIPELYIHIWKLKIAFLQIVLLWTSNITIRKLSGIRPYNNNNNSLTFCTRNQIMKKNKTCLYDRVTQPGSLANRCLSFEVFETGRQRGQITFHDTIPLAFE